MPDEKNNSRKNSETDGTDTAKARRKGIKRAKEFGGREGPDPTRYGDWEKAGRCIDF